MPNESETSLIAIEYTPEFKRNLRQLAKRYRRIKTDIQPLLDALAQGEFPGDQIPGVTVEVYKVRTANTDSGKGKSGGYRIIYQHVNDGRIVLITVYSKVEQGDIAPHEIRRILTEYTSQVEQTDEAGTQTEDAEAEQ